MIKISKTTEKETKDFSLREWHEVDIAHFGKKVDWKEKKFRFKATENGEIVGVTNGKCESGIVYIGAIITAKDSRKKGIGTMLIQRVEEFGKKMKAHKMWLMTGKNWSENEFYQKLDFKLEATLPDFYSHKDFVIYTRPIK